MQPISGLLLPGYLEGSTGELPRPPENSGKFLGIEERLEH